MDGSWRMCAHRYGDGLFYNVGSRRYVEFHGLSYPVLDVDVAEVPDDDPGATHWAWIGAKDGTPIMIEPRKTLFDVCFPYGPQAEVEAGKGRVVRLRVQEVAGA